jgi:hypothetical protein
LFARLARLLVVSEPEQLASELLVFVGEWVVVELQPAVLGTLQNLGIRQPELSPIRAVRVLGFPPFSKFVQPDRAGTSRRLELLPKLGFLVRHQLAGLRRRLCFYF